MKSSFVRHPFLHVLLWLALTVLTGRAQAGVLEVWVAITPTCPYGMAGCWPSACLAVGEFEYVENVSDIPDSYNCTAQVWLKGVMLPNVEEWKQKFESMVGKTYVFRGVEVTIQGAIEEKDGRVLLESPALENPVALEPLQNKLQWNFKKHRAREPEPEEAAAHGMLMAEVRKGNGKLKEVQITGPLGTNRVWSSR